MSTPPKKSVHLRSPEAYNLWSKNYDAFDNPMLAMVDYAFDLEPINVPGKQVVELGCGTGRNVDRLIIAGAASYTGLDESPGMLEQAKAKHPEIAFLRTDITKPLHFKNSSVDFILATLVFEHLPSLHQTLSEAFRILSPGGELRILEIHSALTTHGTGAHFQLDGNEIVLPSYTHDATEWERELKTAGFQNVAIKELKPEPAAIARCAKLAKHRDKPVLLFIRAGRPS